MSDLAFPLLRTKLYPPLPAPIQVPRQRLVDKLLDRLDATLTMIVASAGSGKTTLVVQWLEHISWPVAWLSLDETDNDPGVFLTYFIAAIHTVVPGACIDTERLLRARQSRLADFPIATLINELNGIPQPIVLVLDDYHHIRDVSIHQFIGQLLHHAPLLLHLVITSRFDPPLPVSRLASRGKLVEIRATDLRFRTSEAQALLERISGVRLAAERVDALVKNFDGWAVGLQSVALSLRRGDAATNLAGDLSADDHRRLIGILGDEVFSMQPAEVRDFLVRTSLLGQLTASLCQFLLTADSAGETAATASQAMLERLERDGLFIEALDEERRWYRYHNLFRTFLAHKLAQTCSSAEIAVLQHRAAVWYWQEGNAAEALRHALAAQDIALATDVVEASLCEILNREEWPLLERWLKLLPGAAIQNRPLLLVAQAWVLYFQRKLQAIPPLLAQAETLLEEGAMTAAAPSSIRCDLETLHALMFLAAGDFRRTAECSQRALCYVELGRDFGRGIAVFLQGMASYAVAGEEQAVAFCVTTSDNPLESPVVRARALESLCHIFGIACRPIEQERAARALLKLAQEHRLDVSAAWAHRHLGSSYYERNELAAAIQHFSRALEQRYLAHFTCARDCFIGLALAYQAQGRSVAAEAAAAEMQAFYVDCGLTNLPEVDSFQARLAYLRGDTGRALQALERVQPALTVPAISAYETAPLTRAMIHVMAGTAAQRSAAVSLLSDLRRLAEANHATWYLIRVLTLQAIALQQEGELASALAHMAQAVGLGAPGRVIRSIDELGPPVKRLLRHLVERGVEPAYVRDLLAVFPPAASERRPAVPSPNGGLVEPLSGREMEVLTLLSQRLSNKEIAASLVVSPLTVKRHVTNILQKLGVASRWEATERAREFGLIPSGYSESDTAS
jgi:LuxR family maltose regulon positive regulatory protein